MAVTLIKIKFIGYKCQVVPLQIFPDDFPNFESDQKEKQAVEHKYIKGKGAVGEIKSPDREDGEKGKEYTCKIDVCTFRFGMGIGLVDSWE